MEKKTWTEYLTIILRTLFMICFAACFVYLLVYSSKHLGEGMIPEEIQYLDSWVYQIEDSGVVSAHIPINADSKKGETVVFHSVLPETVSDGQFISTLNSKNIIVEINGEVRYKWTRDEADVPGGPTHAAYIFIPLYDEDANSEIRITKYGDTYNGALSEIIVGESYSVANYLEKSNSPMQFLLALFVLGFSLVIVVAGLVISVFFHRDLNIISIGLGALTASAWLILDSFEFQLFFGVKHIGGFLSYVMAMLMPLPFIAYIDKIQKFRYKNFHSFLSIVELFNLITCMFLQFSGIVNLYDSLLFMNGVIIVITICALGSIVYDFFVGRIQNYLNSAIGLFLFMILGIVEIAFLKQSASRAWSEGLLIEVGLLILLVLSIVQQIFDIYSVEKKRDQEFQVNVARNEFLTNMSHEIRTPLNAILGMNEMIMQENQSVMVREYSEHISHAGQVLLSLVNEVLDYSALQNGKDNIENVDYNPRLMIESVCAVLRDNVEAKGLGLNIGMPGNLPEVINGDERHIVRILTNLSSNAVKFTDKGSITFAAECEETEEGYMLEFYIKDTGVGIKKEDLKMLFSPFNRVDLKNNRSRDGAGLGLAIAKTLVDEMGGEIKAESVFGEGSTFIVRVPQWKALNEGTYADEKAETVSEQYSVDASLSEADADENSASVKDANKDNDSSNSVDDSLESISVSYEAPKACVLAVDDNNSNLIVVKEFLRKTKINLETVVSGSEAIERCKVKKYDIILMDHMMPEPDGIATMHTIRESLESINRKTKILVLTANVIGDFKRLYLAEGFDGYLSKPVDRITLLKTIRKFLGESLIQEIDDNLDGSSEAGSTTSNNAVANLNGEITDDFTDKGIIDFESLFNRFEKQASVVNMILGECIKEGERKIVLLRELFETGDIERYAVEAHGVKGVMASICAVDFSAHAKEHEFAAKDKRVEFIENDIDSLLEEYRTVLDFIKDYLTSQGIEVAKPVVVDYSDDDDSMENIISCIELALDDFDVDEALKQIGRLENIVPEDMKSIVEEIRQNTDDFEYDLAKESLKKLQ